MKTTRTILVSLLIAAIIAACYVLSYRFFVRAHIVTSIMGGRTTTYMAVPNTVLNRALLTIYAPLIRNRYPAGTPVILQ